MSLLKYFKDIWLFIVMTVMGLVMVFLIPPFQKPDEVVHFLSAASLSTGRYAVIESRFSAMPERLKSLKIAHKYELKFHDANLFYKDENRAEQFHEFVPSITGYLSYLPSVAAIKIFKFIDTPVTIFYLSRLLGLILFLTLMGISFKVIPKEYRFFLVAYGLMPMVLHQVTEVSYDVMLLSLAPVLFAFTVKLLKSKTVNLKDFVLLILFTATLILVKPGYYALGLCPVLIIWKMMRNYLLDRNWLLVLIGVTLVMMVNVGLWMVLNKFEDKGYNQISPSYQIEILKNNPAFGLKVLSDTWEAKQGFYTESLLGYFGWLDYKYDIYGYLLVASLFLFIVIQGVREIKKPLLDGLGIVILSGIVIGTYILIELIFWLFWTDVGSSVVEGVQGRYFLPLVPFVVWLFLEVFLKLGTKKCKAIVVGVLIFLIGINTYKSIFNRYYDYSRNVTNQTELLKEIEDQKKQDLPQEMVNSRDRMIRYFDTGKDDMIGGFQFAMSKNDAVIRVPYRYKITDEGGKKVYKTGYLIQKRLQDNGIYETNFDKVFEPKGKVVALEIEPVVKNNDEKYFDYVSLYNEIQSRWLFVTKETK